MSLWFINPRRKIRRNSTKKSRSRAAKRAANTRWFWHRRAGLERISTPSGVKTVRGAQAAGRRARREYWRTPEHKARRLYTGSASVHAVRDVRRVAESKHLSNPKRKRAKRNPRSETLWQHHRAGKNLNRPTYTAKGRGSSTRSRWGLLAAYPSGETRTLLAERAAARKKSKGNPKRKKRKTARKGSAARKSPRKNMSKKLYGAALKARKKRLAKARRARSRRKTSRRNPGGISATKKGQSAIRRRYLKMLKRRGIKGVAARDLYGYAEMRATAKRKRKAAGKKAAATRKRNKAKRSKAAKKAAAKRKRSHKRPSKVTKRRKGRKGGSKKMAKRRRKGAKRVRRLSARGRRKRYGRGVRALRRARHSIKFARKHGSGLAKRYLRRYKMRSNPLALVKQIMKDVLPVAVGLFAARAIGANVDRVPMVGGLLAKAGSAEPVARAVLVGGVMYAATISKSPLSKFRGPAMVGAGLNLVMAAVNAFAPESVKGYIGAGDVSYDMAGYQSDMADYEQTGEYSEVSNYEEVGGWADGLTKGVGRHSALKQLASRSIVDEVPDFSEDDVQEGIFAGSGWGVN